MENQNEIEQNEKYDLRKRKIHAKNLMKKYLFSENKNEKDLNEIMQLDDTLPEIYSNKLKTSDDIKLKEKSYDIVDKALLKEFKIVKRLNYKELYFELISYVKSIKLNEPANASKDFELEKFEKEKKNKSEEKVNNNNFNEIKEHEGEKEEEDEREEEEEDEEEEEEDYKFIQKVDIKEKNDLDENLSDTEFKNIIEKKENYDITKVLIKNEEIKVEDIKKKFSEIFDIYCKFINFKNNYPEFESELFYFNSLRYMLETYKELKYRRFIEKIALTVQLSPLTEKIKNNKINNILTKRIYYYIMNTQYNFDNSFLELLIDEAENDSNILENNDYIIKNNNLYKKTDENTIVLKNVDNYLINKIIKKNILLENTKDVLINKYYSIKGILNNSSFKREDGDIFWDEFLSSNILNDLVKHLYNKENIFNKKVVIDLFKESSFYFPNYNTSFVALTHKELFNMYFPPSDIRFPSISLKNCYTFRMINKAVNKIKIQHEWGHGSSAFLFMNFQIKYFTTPKRKFILKENSETNDKKKIIYEGGKAVEFLLYKRIINRLNAKEAIFILNGKNYELTLENFQKKFINLKNLKLIDVFEEAIKNPNIDELVIKAYKEYKKKGKGFKYNVENYSFKVKEKGINFADLEKTNFKIGNNYHHRYSYK